MAKLINLLELQVHKVDNWWILHWLEDIETENEEGRRKVSHSEVFTYESALGLRIFELLNINQESKPTARQWS